jgi:hypothetical protein
MVLRQEIYKCVFTSEKTIKSSITFCVPVRSMIQTLLLFFGISFARQLAFEPRELPVNSNRLTCPEWIEHCGSKARLHSGEPYQRTQAASHLPYLINWFLLTQHVNSENELESLVGSV